MCGLICALQRDRRGYLPHGRKDLYEAALSMLLIRRDRERDMKVPDLREEPQLDLLQRLAYWLIKNGRTVMDRSRAEDIIARALPSVPEAAALGGAPVVFEHFLQRSGLLREPAPDTVDFIHRTFQDFLGARAAVEEGDFGLLISHAADDQWEDVIRMAVALARPAERVAILRDLLARGDGAVDERTRSRVYLLAAACLEHATTLDPGTREAVEGRTATLIPPSSIEEARALAEVGPLILGLLPGPENLGNQAAYHVVIAASHVQSDAAIPFLAQFATCAWLPVRSQLLWAWSRFATADYADEVIAHLDPSGLLYTVRSDEQLAQLERPGCRLEALDVRKGVSPAALAKYVGRSSLRELVLAQNPVSDLGFLRGQSALESLDIAYCRDLTDLSAISGLPIRTLRIVSAGPDLDLQAVAQLGELESFTVHGPAGMHWSPQALPRDVLETLVVSGGVSPAHTLDGLGRLSGLKTLMLNAPSSPVSDADWREILELASLVHLEVSAEAFETLPARATLPELASLTLVSDSDSGVRVVQTMIRRLPAVFPGLQECRLLGDFDAEGYLDIAPLAALTTLREVHIAANRSQILGAELLSPSVRLRCK